MNFEGQPSSYASKVTRKVSVVLTSQSGCQQNVLVTFSLLALVAGDKVALVPVKVVEPVKISPKARRVMIWSSSTQSLAVTSQHFFSPG